MSNLLLLGAGGPVSSGPALWTPNDEAGLLGWWDFADTGSFSGGTWTKRWGTLGNWTLDSGVGPTKITNGFSGDKHALSFTDTSNQGLTLSSPGVTELWMAIAMDVKTTAAAPLIFNRTTSGVGTQGIQMIDTYGLQVRYRDDNNAEYYDLTMPQQVLLIARMSTNSKIIRVNGILGNENTTASTGTAPSSTDSFKLFRDVADGGYVIQVAAVGVFTNASYTTGLAEKVEGYIAHNNLGHTTAILPGGHTYKTNAPTV